MSDPNLLAKPSAAAADLELRDLKSLPAVDGRNPGSGPSPVTEAGVPPAVTTAAALSQRIDFLRGVFSLWVLIVHTYYLHTQLSGGSLKPSSWLQKWGDVLMNSGYFGVTGFFFLSGFCIQWSISNKSSRHEGRQFDFRAYCKARFTRLAPIFYIGLLFAVGVEYACSKLLVRAPGWDLPLDPTAPLLWSLLSLQGLFGTFGCYAASWSITNEVIFYAAWPLAWVAAKRKVLSAFLISVTAALLLTAGFYLLWKMSGSPEEHFKISLWTIPMSSLMWYIGALSRTYFDVIVQSAVFKFMQRYCWWLAGLWVLWANTLGVLDLSLLLRTLMDPFVYLIFPLVVLANWRVPTQSKPTKWLADLSYPLYLFHGPILILISSILITCLPTLPRLMVAIVAGLTALAVSGTAGVWVERTFMNLRRKAIKR